MKEMAKNYGGIILCVFELIIGILLLINPEGFTSAIFIAAGCLLIVAGIVSVVKYFRTDAEIAAQGSALSSGLCEIVLGAFLGIGYQLMVGSFFILTVLYGVSLLASGFFKVQTTVDMVRLKNQKWFIAAASALVAIICALVILLLVPYAGTVVLWRFAGIVLIVESVADAAVLIVNKKKDAKMSEEVVPYEN